MQIRQTIQPIPVSKVEEDQRTEVSKIQPLGTSQDSDSFENGCGTVGGDYHPEPGQKGYIPPEPKMKADPITDDIFFRQMTAARIGESGNPKMKPKAENNSADSSNENIHTQANKIQQELRNHFKEFQSNDNPVKCGND